MSAKIVLGNVQKAIGIVIWAIGGIVMKIGAELEELGDWIFTRAHPEG